MASATASATDLPSSAQSAASLSISRAASASLASTRKYSFASHLPSLRSSTTSMPRSPESENGWRPRRRDTSRSMSDAEGQLPAPSARATCRR